MLDFSKSGVFSFASAVEPVLYVEDQPDDVFFMQHVWEIAGIKQPLIIVKDGQEAIDYLAGKGAFADRKKSPLPCLVLLDLNLPVKNGFEVLKWIRQQPNLKELKVVVVSGSNQERDIENARTLGITDYLVKPSGLNRLMEAIQGKIHQWLAKE